MARDYYEVLGIAADASPEELKKSYRRLAKQYHPDVNKGNKSSEDRFKEISEAYSILSDPEKRKQYDMLRRYGGVPPGAGFGGGPAGGFRWTRTAGGPSRGEAQEFEFPGFDGLGDLFGELFNMGGVRGRRPSTGAGRARGSEASVRGQDISTSVEISFSEAIYGTEREITIDRDGRRERIKVKIPPGVDSGSRVRVAGKGGGGAREAGDMYLDVRVLPDPHFRREGADVYTEVPITIYESVLGAKIDVPTLDGTAKMTVPSCTSSGQKFRLKGKGAPIPGKRGTGDLYVIARIVPPPQVDEATRHLCEQLAREHPYNPRK